MKSLLGLIHEINILWNPVFPFLARHIHDLYGRQDGRIVEIGPFSGVIFELLKKNVGTSFVQASFPKGISEFFLKEAQERNLKDRIEILETDESLTGLPEDSIDLAIFRGAFFFPSLFDVGLQRIYQTLRPGGMGFVGGGFGKFTPEEVIRDIGKKSRDLNLQIGKVEIREDDLREKVQRLNMKGRFDVITEGGLWVVMKKQERSDLRSDKLDHQKG